jgi:AcrR family transcriptional regulator
MTDIANKKPKGGDKRQRNTLGKASREQILLEAEKLLKSQGYHSLSTRKVADACGISVGNLTYHFPNKSQLIEALILDVCERYEHERSTIKFNKALNPVSYLNRVIGWMLDDAVDPEVSGLFLELWILAKHHDFASKTLERFYQTATSWIGDSLEIYFPNSTEKQRQQAAYFMLTLSEGTVAVFSRPIKRPVNQKDIVEFAVNAVLTTLGE